MKDNKSYIVYKHTAPNGKIYIGISFKKLEERSGNNGIHYKKNKYFYNSILKYGWNNFKHEILCEGLDEKEASEKEKYYIEFYQSNNILYGYNFTSGGEVGFILNNDVKNKISKKTKEQWSNIESREKLLNSLKGSHIGICTDKQKEVYKLKKEKTLKKKLIIKFLKNIRKMIKGKRYLTDEEKRIISIKTKEAMNNPETKKKISEANKRRIGLNFKNYILQYSLKNELLGVYKGEANAGRETNISKTAIHNCLSGKSKTAGGFIWKKISKEEYKNEIV